MTSWEIQLRTTGSPFQSAIYLCGGQLGDPAAHSYGLMDLLFSFLDTMARKEMQLHTKAGGSPFHFLYTMARKEMQLHTKAGGSPFHFLYTMARKEIQLHTKAGGSPFQFSRYNGQERDAASH